MRATLRVGDRETTVCRIFSCRAALTVCDRLRSFFDIEFPGGHRSRVTPVPIPNTEVKPATADGTAGATLWESRSLPGLFRPGRRCRAHLRPFFLIAFRRSRRFRWREWAR